MAFAMSKERSKNTLSLTLRILIGLLLGIACGALIPEKFKEIFFGLEIISDIYMNALRMMIFPLVFCSVVIGIQGIGSISAMGKIGGQALLYFISTTLFASFLGLTIPRWLHLGYGVNIALAKSKVEPAKFTSLLDTVKNLVPANPITSFAEGNMLQVLVFAIIIGITCMLVAEKALPFIKLVQAINDISLKVVEGIMYITPLGVFSSIALVVHANGNATIVALGQLIVTLYVTIILYILIFYGGIVKFIGHFSAKRFFISILPAALTAFGTCSSSATLPITKQCADDMEIPEEISSFTLPLGSTINMDAVSIVMSFMLVFFADACQIKISFGMFLILILSNTLLSIGAPGVPGSAIACFAALAVIAGLPAGVVGVYISINTLCDMIATSCNVLGDLACSVAMKRTVKLDNKLGGKAAQEPGAIG